MDLRSILLLLSALFASGLIVFLARSYGGGEVTAGAMGTLIALAIGFAVYFSLERATERYDTKQSVQRLEHALEQQEIAKKKKRIEERAFANRNRTSEAFIEKAQGAFNLGGVAGVKQKLLAAGFAGDQAIFYYTLFKTVVPVVGMFVGGALALVFSDRLFAQIFFAIASWALVFYGTEYVIKKSTDRRRQRIKEELPDVLDLMVIYTESGKSFDNALAQIIEKAAKRYPTTVSEFRFLDKEFQVASSREEAYDNFARRANIDLVKRFVSIIKQSERVGSPISNTLKMLSSDSRKERMLEAERRAAKIPVLIQLPIVLFILPSIFLLVLGPVGIKIMDALMRVAGLTGGGF